MILGNIVGTIKIASLSSIVLVASSASLLGCPADTEETPSANDAGDGDGARPDGGASDASADADAPAALAPTHSGLVSIQDIAIANLPQAGHGLTVSVLFNRTVAPDYDDNPGQPTGCRAWSFDTADKPSPALEDHGTLHVDGIENGPLTCIFQPSRGYVCPTANGTSETTVATSAGPTTTYTLPDATFSTADVGRYLQVSGAATPANNGAFAIVATPTPTQVVVTNARATSESFSATYTVLGGAGPTPNDLYTPFAAGREVTIGLTEGGGAAFTFPSTSLTPGQPFVLEESSSNRIQNIPVTGEAVTLACSTCGEADGTIVRITTTDADLGGLSPAAMPKAKRKSVEIQCAVLGAGEVMVPAAAMDLVRRAHAASPITRIRTAFMRDGVAVHTNPPPKAPNRMILVAGRGVLGFTQPEKQ